MGTYFDETARRWDTPRRVERARYLVPLLEQVLDGGTYSAGLELGCGTGLISLPLAHRFRELYCVDRSAEMLEVLGEKCAAAGVGNIFPRGLRFLTDTANRGRFDVAFGSMVFHHMDDLCGELRSVRSLLKKTGRLLAVDLDTADPRLHAGEPGFRGVDGFDRGDFASVLEICGFRDAAFSTVYRGEKELAGERVPYSLFLCTALCR